MTRTGTRTPLILVLIPLLLALAAASQRERTLPSTWKTCSRSDPNLDSCLKDAINEAIADISVSGLKEFGVFPIDPFNISRLTVAQGSGPVSINLNLKNVVITGFKDLRFKSIRSDLDHHRIKGAPETLPQVSLEGDYKINGQLLILPIAGEGKCHLSFRNLNSELDLVMTPVMKGGQSYLNVSQFVMSIEPERFIINFENLFNGNKQLSDQMNKFMNDNWRVLLKELTPALQDAFGTAWADTCNRIFLKVPSDKIFPK